MRRRQGVGQGDSDAQQLVRRQPGLRDPSTVATAAAPPTAVPEPRSEKTWRNSKKEALELGSALRAVIEEGGESSHVALGILREEEDRKRRHKAREEAQGFVLRGIITAAAGIALMPFLYFLIPEAPIWPVGSIALLVGIVLFGWGRHLLKQQPGED